MSVFYLIISSGVLRGRRRSRFSEGTNVIRYFPTQALNFAFKDAFKVGNLALFSACVRLTDVIIVIK